LGESESLRPGKKKLTLRKTGKHIKHTAAVTASLRVRALRRRLQRLGGLVVFGPAEEHDLL
jgi:hypothetical protein